jgi:hypothetical protein
MTGAVHRGKRREAHAGVSVTSDEATGNSALDELNHSCVLLSGRTTQYAAASIARATPAQFAPHLARR